MNLPMPRTGEYASVSPPPPRLLDGASYKIRPRHYNICTEKAYVDWVRRYLHFHGLRHPEVLSAQAVEAFLTHPAVEGNVAAATQNQAKSALHFLHKEVLGIALPWLDGVASEKQSQRLPVVPAQAETARMDSAPIAARTRPLSALVWRSNCISRPGVFHDLTGLDNEPMPLALFFVFVDCVIAMDRTVARSLTPLPPTPIRRPATLRAPCSSDPRSMPFARRDSHTTIRRPPDLGGPAVRRWKVQTDRPAVGAAHRSPPRPGSTTIRAHPPPPGGACPLPSSR